MSRIPDKLDLSWFAKNMDLTRNLMRYADQHKAAAIVSPAGKVVPGRYSHTSKNVIYDLREVETSAEPVVIQPPYLTVTEDDANVELDVSWTLPEEYDELFLERSEDGISGWTALATLAGTVSSYDDAAVTVGVEEFYRIRGTVGGAYSAYSNIDSGILVSGFELYGWGENANGRLGIGSSVDQLSPYLIDAATDYVQVALGAAFGLGLKSDGTLWSWGLDTSGQLGIGPTELYDPSVDVIQGSESPLQVGTDSDWAFVSTGVGCAFAVGIKTTGTLWAWGYNGEGQLGQNDIDTRYKPVQVGSATDWASADCGGNLVFLIKTNGELWRIGDHPAVFGADALVPEQVGSDTDWASVSCSTNHVMAIKTTGTLWTMGENDLGELGLGDTTPRTSMTQIGALTTWAKVSTGSTSTVAIKTDGTMWSWGWNTSGCLGLGNTTNYDTPQQIGALTTWANIKCGQFFAVARKTDGTLWAWGEDNVGQLGQGSATGSSTSPVQVGAETTWGEIFDCGNDSTLAILSA
jgi:alpha-tubulin suppressor-like RCC1 family protein